MPPIRPIRSYTVHTALLPLDALPAASDSASASGSTSPNSPVFGNLTNAEPRTRRKISPHQLAMLEAMYAKNTHPDRRSRQECADDSGMDLKAVTVWLQNKRQAVKKANGGGSSGSSSSCDGELKKPSLRRTASAPTFALSQSLPAAHRISLDIVASRMSLNRIPRRVVSHSGGVLNATIQRVARASRASTPDRAHALSLWARMPPSPEVRKSSPACEHVEPTPRTLEWACARDSERLRRSSSVSEDDGSEGSQTTVEDDELRTPEVSFCAPAVPAITTQKQKPAPPVTVAATAEPAPVSTNKDEHSVAASILLMLAGRQ